MAGGGLWGLIEGYAAARGGTQICARVGPGRFVDVTDARRAEAEAALRARVAEVEADARLGALVRRALASHHSVELGVWKDGDDEPYWATFWTKDGARDGDGATPEAALAAALGEGGEGEGNADAARRP